MLSKLKDNLRDLSLYKRPLLLHCKSVAFIYARTPVRRAESWKKISSVREYVFPFACKRRFQVTIVLPHLLSKLPKARSRDGQNKEPNTTFYVAFIYQSVRGNSWKRHFRDPKFQRLRRSQLPRSASTFKRPCISPIFWEFESIVRG